MAPVEPEPTRPCTASALLVKDILNIEEDYEEGVGEEEADVEIDTHHKGRTGLRNDHPLRAGHRDAFVFIASSTVGADDAQRRFTHNVDGPCTGCVTITQIGIKK